MWAFNVNGVSVFGRWQANVAALGLENGSRDGLFLLLVVAAVTIVVAVIQEILPERIRVMPFQMMLGTKDLERSVGNVGFVEILIVYHSLDLVDIFQSQSIISIEPCHDGRPGQGGLVVLFEKVVISRPDRPTLLSGIVPQNSRPTDRLAAVEIVGDQDNVRLVLEHPDERLLQCWLQIRVGGNHPEKVLVRLGLDGGQTKDLEQLEAGKAQMCQVGLELHESGCVCVCVCVCDAEHECKQACERFGGEEAQNILAGACP